MCSRLRVNPDKLFEVFAEVGRPEQDGADPFILQKYPPDFAEQDVLNNIPKFSFPCKINTSQVDQFAFVLTDLESLYRFGFCRHGTGAQTCLCIISHLPWYEVFYKLLNFLAEIVNRTENNDLLPFLQAAYKQSIPLPNEPVTIVAGQDMFNFTAPDPTSLPSIPASRNLTEYYNAVDTNNMMRIFASMLHERRIIVTSRKLSRVTACIHAAESLLYPMHWQHLYIPVLPEHLVDYVTAPMPYLIGVHTSLMEKILEKRMEIGDAVIVDADKNEVSTEYEDLEALPEDVSSYLKRHLKTQRVQNSMMDCGDAISRAFLQALVRLIGGYRDALKFPDGEAITFDRDAFVLSRSSQSMQVFLENMLQLQIFQQFINGRLELLNDGRGLTDLFEQESVKYTDSLNTQSKYKEWLARVSKQKRKLKAGGKDIISDMKERAAPMMNTAVQSMKNQGKKVMSKVKEMNESKMSSRKVTGGIVHTRQRPTTITGSHLSTSRPPRPPPPSSQRPRTAGQNLRVSRNHLSVEGEEVGIYDDSHLRLSYHSIDVSLMTDADIQNAMMRSASAEHLPPSTLHHDSSSQSASEGDISSTPSSEALSPSDENLTDIPYLDMTTPSPSLTSSNLTTTTTTPAAHSLAAFSSEEDLLDSGPLSELYKDKSAAAPGGGSGADQSKQPLVSGPAPIAPPRAARRTGSDARCAKSSTLPSPQLFRPQSSSPSPSKPSPDAVVEESQVSSRVSERRAEKPLIHFESSESEADGMEQFDPLLCKIAVTDGKRVEPMSVSPSSSSNSSPPSQGLTRNRSSRNSLMRSAAFRRGPNDSPVRSSYRDDQDDGSRDTLANLFDPLASTSSSQSTDPQGYSAIGMQAGNEGGKECEEGSLMHDWTLDQLTSGGCLSAGAATPFVGVPAVACGSGFSRVPSGGTLTCPVSASPPPLSTCPFPPRPVSPMTSALTSKPLYPNPPPCAVQNNPLYTALPSDAVKSDRLFGLAAVQTLGGAVPQCNPLYQEPTLSPGAHTNPLYRPASASSPYSTMSLPRGGLVKPNPMYQLRATSTVQPGGSKPQIVNNSSLRISSAAAEPSVAGGRGGSLFLRSTSAVSQQQRSRSPMFGDSVTDPPLSTSNLPNSASVRPSQPRGEGGRGWETFD